MPKHQHDCDNCEYLSSVEIPINGTEINRHYDLYLHIDNEEARHHHGYTLLARWSDTPENYTSSQYPITEALGWAMYHAIMLGKLEVIVK